MSSKEIYKKEFEKALEVEEKIKGYYSYYMKRLEDPVLLKKFKEIYSDEARHVGIVKSLIAFFS